MFDNYRRVLSVPGALRFSATGVLARLPIAMISLGIVLLVSGARGSYAAAGAVAATYLVANGVCAVVQGRLLDRIGQGRVLSTLMIVSAVAMTFLIVAVEAGWPLGWAHVGAAVTGATLPQVGSAVRARWSHVLTEARQVQTAFALEGALDESVFVAGPILVTVLATTVHPTAGLATAMLLGLVGTLALSAQRATEPPPHRVDRSTGRFRMPWRALVPLAVVAVLLGVMFGSAEVATVAFSEELGAKSRSGLLLSLWAVGSFTAGVITGAVPWRAGPATRLKVGCLALVVVMSPLPLVGSFLLMGPLLLVAGLAIAPTLIASMSVTERVAPTGRLTEAMAIIHTGIVTGVAPGATLAGVVIDRSGASPAYLVAVGAAVLAALFSLSLPRDAGELGAVPDPSAAAPATP